MYPCVKRTDFSSVNVHLTKDMKFKLGTTSSESEIYNLIFHKISILFKTKTLKKKDNEREINNMHMPAMNN